MADGQLERIWIRGARLLDPAAGLDQSGDLLISEGRVAAVGSFPDPDPGKIHRIDARDMICCPGLIDLDAHLREPGQEYKEDIATGTAAAAAGGFTAVCALPGTRPVNDCRAVTEFVLQKAREVGKVRVHPIGAVTQGLAGKAFTEMGELKEAGAVAVSDDDVPIAAAGMMRRALEYAATFDLPLIHHCEDRSLSGGAPMHEGIDSAWTGLEAQPGSAEAIVLARDLILCAETGARYHAAHISTAESVELLRRAKAAGAPVTAAVSIQHLALTAAACRGYDTATKLNPPLRSEADRQACLAAVRDGTIDCIVSGHTPQTSIEKELEYDHAEFGASTLETALAVGLGLVADGALDLHDLIRGFSTGPARALGLPGGDFAIGHAADVALIDPRRAWSVDPTAFASKSPYSPYAGRELTGRAALTIVGGRIVYEAK